ncbi:MAG: SdrD B-like domain-containing protein [Saprospiraceae bacterium]
MVLETQPANYNSISDHDMTIGTFDPDGGASLNDPDNEIAVTLVPNEVDANNDFVEQPMVGTISGYVHNDLGAPLSNVTIKLYNDNNADGNADGVAIGTTTTNALGYYIFTGVVPTYYVVVETNPASYSNISDYDHTTAPPDTDGNDFAQGPDNNIPVRVMPAENDEDNNFVDGRPGQICGTVWDDLNQPLSNIEIRLYLDVNNNDAVDAGDIQVSITFTDGDSGTYCFEDIAPGEYVVSEIQPANYNSVSDYDHTTTSPDTDGDDSAQGPDNEIPVTLTPAEFDGDNDFIEDPLPGSISGDVRNDAGAPLIGVTIRLYNDTNGDGNADGAPIATAVTNTSGSYFFTGVEPGFYVVIELTPASYNSLSDYDTSTAPPDTDGNDSAQGPDDNIPVKLLPGEADEDNDFVDGRPGSICGNVSDDLGVPLANIEIRLYLDVNNNDIVDAGDILVTTTFTDGDSGNYCFEDVTPGEYVISEIQPLNYNDVSDYDHTTAPPDTDGNDSAQGPDNEIPVTLAPNETDANNDFIEDPQPGSISGTVTNEIGGIISGVTIRLYKDTNADGVQDGAIIATAVTNTSGAYIFTGVEPGFWVVVEVNPIAHSNISDYDHSTAPPDTDGNDSGQGPDNNIPVKILPGEPDADNNFVDGRPGTICGTVSDDTGQPLSNVEIELYLDVNNNDSLDAADVLVTTTLTDGDSGNYCFEDVTPGEYVVFEIQPANYSDISDYDHTTTFPDTDGGASLNDPDNEIMVTVQPNEADFNNNFIEDPFTGSISGVVNNEAGGPIENVVITLYADSNNDGNEDGAALATTTTNSSGAFIFTGIEPGLYVIVETQPLNHSNVSDYDQSTSSSDLDGNDSAQGSDNDIPVRILPGEADTDNNFIDGRPGSVCGSVKDDTGLGIANVEVKLYRDINNNDTTDVADVLIATVFSSSGTGNYCFANVAPGEYVIAESQPAFYNSVSDYDHSTSAPDTDGTPGPNDPDNDIAVTLTPNEADIDNNFIEDPFTGSITGFVRNDLNAGIPGIVVKLYGDSNNDGNEDGPALFTTTTNGSGSYTFSAVEPGTYVIVETSPFFYLNISDFDESISGSDLDGDDSSQGADNDIPVILKPGETDADNIFREGRPGNICGFVYDSMNTPLANVEIRLYNDVNNNDSIDAGDILLNTTFTDGDSGGYCFEDVTPGEYVVLEIQPLNYSSVSDYDHTTGSDPDGNDSADGPDNQVPVTLAPGEVDAENNFIEAPDPGSISGYVKNEIGTPFNLVKVKLYKDTNFDGNEDGIAIDSAYTNTSGYYSMTGILPGYYVVVEINPPYHNNISDFDHSVSGSDLDGNDSLSGPDNDIPVIILPGEEDEDNDFVDGRPGRICGYINNDLGVPISNLVIQLYKDVDGDGEMDPEDTMVTSTMSDENTGAYCFEDVEPGYYVLNEVVVPGYGDLSDKDETPDPDGDDSAQGADNNIPVKLDPFEADMDNNFVDIVCPGPPFIIGFSTDTICSGEMVTFQAVDQGVGIVLYAWNFGSGSNPGNAIGIGPHNVTYTSNGLNSTEGATVTLTIEKVGCGTVTEDVANIVVNPIPNTAIEASTESLCYYQPRTFKPLAPYNPNYTYLWNFGTGGDISSATSYGPHTVEYSTTGVKTVQLIVWSNAPGSSCGDTSTISFNVIQCQGNIAGKVIRPDTTPVSGVIIRLFKDVNRDGVSDGGTPVRSANTSSLGEFSMVGLTPGFYVLVESQPANYTSVYALDESDDIDSTVSFNIITDDVIPVTVEPAEVDEDNTWVESPNPGQINGFVYQDLDSDGVPDSGEGISDVVLEVWKDENPTDGQADAGGFVSGTSSLTTGFYAIANLPAGHYVLIETQPAGFLNISDIDVSNDNDLIPNTNTTNDTIPFTIAAGENDGNNYFQEEAEVLCTNIVMNMNDDGAGSLRYVIGCVAAGDTVFFDAGLAGNVIHLTSGRIVIDKNIYIHSGLSPRVMIYSDVPGAFLIQAGNTVEMKNVDITSGLMGELGPAIENYGTLTLWDITVYRNILLPPTQYLVYNSGSGMLTIKGNCRFETD